MGIATGGDHGGHAPPPPPSTSISEPKKVQKFQFQTSAILLFTDVEIIRTRNFTNFTVYATIFGKFVAAFFLTT